MRGSAGTGLRTPRSQHAYPPDLLPRLFDPFVQGARRPNRSEGGLGLGLTIVRSLVELHGGRVSARSRAPERGAEMEVRIPAAAPPARAEEAERAAAARPAGWTNPLRRVLIVDDNVDAAETLAALLRSEGYGVAVAVDGPSALLQAGAFRPDIALLDIGLPGMDGYELARRLRAASGSAGIRLVALTGYGQAADRARALSAGFLEHLIKPIQPEALLSTLERCAAVLPSS
jgi:CheY-like chemotaxis protein